MNSRFVYAILGIAMLTLSWFQTAAAAEIRVLSTPTMKGALDELRPQFERVSGHTVLAVFDGVAALKRRIEAGETFNVAILLPLDIEALMKQGKIAAGSHVDIALRLTLSFASC